MNFPVLNLTVSSSTQFTENTFAKYAQNHPTKPLERLISEVMANQIPTQQINIEPNECKSPISQQNPEATIFLKNLSDRERLQSEFAKISKIKDIDPREFYVRRMMINPYLSAENEHLINEWILDSLPTNDEWQKDFHFKEEKIDRALALLDFENAFALLTAGYLLAHFSFFNGSENLDVIAFFESRLQSLIQAEPEKYQELNLNELSLKHSAALKFNKTSLPFAFISELKEQRNHRLKSEKIIFLSKILPLSILSTGTLLASGFWLGKKFTVLPNTVNDTNNAATSFFSPSVIIATISCLINVYLLSAIYLTEKNEDDLLRFENPKKIDPLGPLNNSPFSSPEIYATPKREGTVAYSKRGSQTPGITVTEAPDNDFTPFSKPDEKPRDTLLQTPRQTEEFTAKTPNTPLLKTLLTPIKTMTNFMLRLNKSPKTPRTLIYLLTHKSPTQREKNIMQYLRDIYIFLGKNKCEESLLLQNRYKELFIPPKRPRRLILE